MADQAEPGPDLDRLVAEKVMGWKRVSDSFRPSTDIAAAWEVLEKMPYGVAVHSPNGKLWRCIIGVEKIPRILSPLIRARQRTVETEATTAPLAICRATLAAIKQGKEPDEPLP